MSVEEASKLKDNRLFVPKDPSLGLIIKDDGRGNLVVIDNEKVVASGKAKDLTQYIQPKPVASAASQPAQPAPPASQLQPQPAPNDPKVAPPSINRISELELTGEATLISGTNRYRLPGQVGQWEKITNDKGESTYIQALTQD
jgi:hypothetical protein